jgi:hypothetical protein
LFLLVDNPKGRYRGQKLKMLVRIKIPERTNKIMAGIPDTVFVKKSITNTIAISILIIRSAFPILSFISSDFKLID